MFPTLLLALAARAAPEQALAAAHSGVWTGSAVEWESTLVLLHGGGGSVPLALPLPPEVELLGPPGASLDGARLTLPDGGRRVTVRLRQPLEEGEAVRLCPPLVAGDLVQRVTLDGGRFEPADALGLDRHLRYLAPEDVDRRERRALDRAVEGRRARVRDQPIYLVADDRLERASGLVGSLEPAGAVPGGVGLAAAGAFLLVVGGLAGGHRLLAVKAREEALDAYIRGEFIGPRAPDRGET